MFLGRNIKKLIFMSQRQKMKLIEFHLIKIKYKLPVAVNCFWGVQLFMS